MAGNAMMHLLSDCDNSSPALRSYKDFISTLTDDCLAIETRIRNYRSTGHDDESCNKMRQILFEYKFGKESLYARFASILYYYLFNVDVPWC